MYCDAKRWADDCARSVQEGEGDAGQEAVGEGGP